MAKTVFILGAGASKLAGGPLMTEFLDKARSFYPQMEDAGSLKIVFDAIEKLKVIHYKSYADLDNIEHVFGLIEMARLIKLLADFSEDEIEALNKAVKRLIVLTLERSIKFPLRNNSIYPLSHYTSFAQIIQKVCANNKWNNCAILSFNYDVVFDFAFHYHQIPIDYCLEVKSTSALKFLKLHGSLNWASCEKCQSIVPVYLRDYFAKRTFFNPFGDVSEASLDIGSRISEFEHCKIKLSSEPYIVPPTWNKAEYHGALFNVWAQAAREFADAEHVIIMGFSLPETDLFFRYLFALGGIGKGHIRTFCVVDPDRSPELRARYESIIGRGIIKRFEMLHKTFDDALPYLGTKIGIK